MVSLVILVIVVGFVGILIVGCLGVSGIGPGDKTMLKIVGGEEENTQDEEK